MPKGPPAIIGEPLILQKGSSVNMECLVESAAAPKVLWFREEGETTKEITAGDKYKMSQEGAGADKTKVICEILNFEKVTCWNLQM